MQKPVVIVNFKTYAQASGEKALHLARVCEEVANSLDADIRIAVQTSDIRMIAKEVSIPVYAQHVDAVTHGSHTGWVLPENVKEAGAIGTLLNHSEHRLEMENLKECVKRAREVGLAVVICAVDDVMGEAVSALNPDFVAVEPPELIGGDISISTAQPELITNSVNKICKNNPDMLLVGAGVKTGADVKLGLELGASGVLLASGITKAEDPEKALRGLLEF